MGPEIAAIVGPIAGGLISVILWYNEKNYEYINTGFNNLNTNVNVIERKVDDIRLDVVKNYVTNDELVNHIKSEEDWHKMMLDEIKSLRKEIVDVRIRLEDK